MKKTIKIIILVPYKEDHTWRKPLAMLRQKDSAEGQTQDWQIPLIIEDTQCYPFDLPDEGQIEITAVLAREIMTKAEAQFGIHGARAIKERLASLRIAHKPEVREEAVAYLFFSDFFEKDEITKNNPVLLEQSELLTILEQRRNFQKALRRYNVTEGQGRHNLTDEDIEALRRTFRYFVLKEKNIYTSRLRDTRMRTIPRDKLT